MNVFQYFIKLIAICCCYVQSYNLLEHTDLIDLIGD